MKENSIEEDIKIIKSLDTLDDIELKNAIEHILSAYKRALKENERYQKSDYETICLENNELREITDRIQSEYNDLLKDNFKLKDELETKRKEYQETYKDVREELKELRKDNEELKKDRNNNYQMIALAQNEALEYMQGYEDGKKLRRSAVANIIENQQYYIIKKQMEKYEEHIKRLQKENEELKDTNCLVKRYFKLKDTNTYLQKENDELKKQRNIEPILINNKMYFIDNEIYNELLEDIKSNYTSVQKVKDKIEKLNDESHAEELEDIMNRKNYTITELVQYVLQELLEGRK